MGRFLIDVPAGSRLSGGNYKYDFIGIEPVKAMTYEEFATEVDRVESKLRFAQNKRTQQGMLLQSVQLEKGTRILAAWKVDVSTAQIHVLGYRWINGSRFLLEDDVGGSKQEFGMNRMQEALSRLHPRADTEIPTDPASASPAASSPTRAGVTKRRAWTSISPATPMHSCRSGFTRSPATGTTDPCSTGWAA